MGALALKAFNFAKGSIADIRSCTAPGDKLALACGRVGRVITFAVNALFGKNVLNPHLFLYRDITMQTDAGIFYCRRMTNDFGAVSVTHEPGHRQYFELSEGVFVDIGANIGKYTVMVARKLGSNGQVVAIEADPDNYKVLCKNVELNQLSNVIPVHAACGADNKPVVLHRHPWGPGLHTTNLSLAADRGYASEFTESMTVGGVALDTLLDDLGISNVNLIKIDAEYAEMAILKGAVRTLQRSPAVTVVIEATTEAALAFFRARGFKLTRIGYEDYVARANC